MFRKVFLFSLLIIAFSPKIYAQRKNISLDGRWNFMTDSTKAGINNKWYQNGLPEKKEQVSVPHTWNIVEKTAKYSGWAWYERKIEVPAKWKGSSIKIQFNAVYHDATIWINGQKAGEHKSSGFTKFFIEASKLLIPGKQNSVVVLADNSFSKENIPYLKSFDWANDGGIIRSVYMVSTERPRIEFVHILAKPDLSTPAHQGKGVANIKIKLSELGKIDISKVAFNIKIKECNQATSKLIYAKKIIPTIKNGEAQFDIAFDKINRWHFNDPNLYTFKLSVLYKNKATDADTTDFGFREFKTVGDKFVFNGENIRTAGVEWMGGSSLKNGMAENKDEIRESLEKLKYLNTMYTRFHLQQDDYVYDWCNKHGIMIQQEIPIWGHSTMMTDTILRIAKFQLDETIANAYSQPSIVSWGVGNEVDARKQINIDGIKELYHYTKNLDNSRLVNYVSNTLQNARSWNPGILTDGSSYGDVMMYNDYHSTWYRQAKAGRGPLLDSIQAENRKMPLMISEFGLCEPENWGDDQKRIVDMINNYSVYESKSYIAGVIYFCMNDYRTHMGKGKYGFNSTRVHGVYDLEGKAKPSAEMLRELNCPIDVTGLNRNKENAIDIEVVASLGFPSYQLRDFKFYWSENVKDYRLGEVNNLPLINPGKTFRFIMKNKYNNKGVMSIENGRGELVYQKVIDETGVYF
jgi:beta-galactosidase